VLWLFALGFVALLPTLFKGKLQDAIEKPDTKVDDKMKKKQ
jgi:hypothetical protein